MILIVEDDSAHNISLTTMLRKECGVEAVSAFSVQGALALLDGKQKWTAIVCDHQLQDGEALEIFNHLLKKQKLIPFLVYASQSLDTSSFNAPFFLGAVLRDAPMLICAAIQKLS